MASMASFIEPTRKWAVGRKWAESTNRAHFKKAIL